MIGELSQLITDVLKTLDTHDVLVSVVPTDDPSHGDYATSVAFQVAKKLGMSPMEAAELLCKALSAHGKAELVEKIEVAKPGFINFTLSHQALLKNLSTEHNPSTGLPAGRRGSGQEDSARQSGSCLKAKKIMVEFTDPNPFKELHIGHLYSNIVGESISRLLEANGAEVRRVCYQGDVGMHVAKSLWGLGSKLKTQNVKLEEIEVQALDERAKFLGEAYALGATAFEESEVAKQEITVINKQVYLRDPEVMEMYTKGRQWSLDYFESMYQRLGTNFTKLYFESDAGPIGLQLVKSHPEVFKESNGAIIFAGEEYGLHTRVFINSLGLPTYEAKELGLAVTKYGDYPYDQSIMVTGNEINEYFKVLLKAISLIRPDIAPKMMHISHGIVRLPEGKMSSRTGKIVRAEWLLDEAVARAKTKIDEVKEGQESQGDQGSRVAQDEREQVVEQVGLGAVKWALLRSGLGKDIEFSFDDSVSFEGNSGPYLQYTFVRTQSILAKDREQRTESRNSDPTLLALGSPLNPEERRLLVMLCQYSDIVEQAAQKYSPSTLATYLFELAQLFNNFYQKHQILKEEGQIRDFRLVLTAKVGETLKNGLYLLGIQSPERM